MLLETEGIVLGRRKITESDVGLTIFTRKHGKVSAIANGARSPRSRLMACAHPFVYGEFTLSRGRDTWRLSQAQITDSFYSIREDLQKLGLGSYMLELTEAVTQENQTNNRLFDLLVENLSLIKNMETGYNILRVAFELRIFALSGIRPKLDGCVDCGTAYDEGPWGFAPEDGGLICPDCMAEMEGIAVDEVFIRLLRFLTDAPLQKVLDTAISRSLIEKVIFINRRYTKAHITDRPFKSLSLLKNMGSKGELL